MAAITAKLDLQPLEQLQFKTTDFTTIQLETSCGKMYIYLCISNLQILLNHTLINLFRQVMDSLRGKDMLIAIDANAESPLWQCVLIPMHVKLYNVRIYQCLLSPDVRSITRTRPAISRTWTYPKL